MPADWEICLSEEWRLPFYWHPNTGTVSWTWPTIDPDMLQKTLTVLRKAERQYRCLKRATEDESPDDALRIVDGWVVGVRNIGSWTSIADVPWWLQRQWTWAAVEGDAEEADEAHVVAAKEAIRSARRFAEAVGIRSPLL